MLIYFDESYDNAHKFMILGALFNPHPAFLHRRLSEIKRNHGYLNSDGSLKEIKYNLCFCIENFNICRGIIDSFLESTSWFRAIVVKSDFLDLSYFGRPYETVEIKKARAYKKFAELLIAHNTENTFNAVLLTDRLTRCNGDEFIERMKECFSMPGVMYSINQTVPTLKHIAEVESSLEQYHVIQVCDLLTGCVLNNLVPTVNQYKNSIRLHLVGKLGVKNLLPESWSSYSKTFAQAFLPKFNVWYWKPKR